MAEGDEAAEAVVEQTQTQTQGKPVRRFAIPTGLVALVGAPIGAWYTMPDLQAQVCKPVLSHAGFAAGVCKPEFRRVDEAAATDELDTFFRRVGGSNKAGARANLTSELNARMTDAELALRWPATVVAVERVGPVARLDDRFNQFEVVYRQYNVGKLPNGKPAYQAATGAVLRYRMTVRMKGTENGPRIDAVESVTKTSASGEGRIRSYARAKFVVDTVTWKAPGSSDIVFSDVRATKTLRILCSWTDTTGATWYRTYGGWADGSDLTVEQLPDEGIVECAGPGAEAPRR